MEQYLPAFWFAGSCGNQANLGAAWIRSYESKASVYRWNLRTRRLARGVGDLDKLYYRRTNNVARLGGEISVAQRYNHKLRALIRGISVRFGGSSLYIIFYRTGPFLANIPRPLKRSSQKRTMAKSSIHFVFTSLRS
jgi:hypothetical protein